MFEMWVGPMVHVGSSDVPANIAERQAYISTPVYSDLYYDSGSEG